MATTSTSDRLWEAISDAKRCADALREAKRHGRRAEAARRTAALCYMIDYVHWIARRERYGGAIPGDDAP